LEEFLYRKVGKPGKVKKIKQYQIYIRITIFIEVGKQSFKVGL
jgi:hypothetical protein